MSWMLMKSGYQVCPHCKGEGCWRCQRRGYILRCPRCRDIDTQSKEGNHFLCLVCDYRYNKDGSEAEERTFSQ